MTLADAGCRKISFRVGSGSARILTLIKKGITVDQARNAVKWSREAGIELTFKRLLRLKTKSEFIIGSAQE